MTRSDSEILARAAQLIEEHGHTKRKMGAPSLGFCTGGAVLWACHYDGEDLALRYGPLTERLEGTCRSRWGMSVPQWNDRPERTAAEAVAFLREFVEES